MKHILSKREKEILQEFKPPKFKKPTKKEVRLYIKHYIEKAKEDWEESYPDKFDVNFVIIPYMSPFYIDPFNSNNSFEKAYEYAQLFNSILIAEMTKRGYKAHWCDEDIEFYK